MSVTSAQAQDWQRVEMEFKNDTPQPMNCQLQSFPNIHRLFFYCRTTAYSYDHNMVTVLDEDVVRELDEKGQIKKEWVLNRGKHGINEEFRIIAADQDHFYLAYLTHATVNDQLVKALTIYKIGASTDSSDWERMDFGNIEFSTKNIPADLTSDMQNNQTCLWIVVTRPLQDKKQSDLGQLELLKQCVGRANKDFTDFITVGRWQSQVEYSWDGKRSGWYQPIILKYLENGNWFVGAEHLNNGGQINQVYLWRLITKNASPHSLEVSREQVDFIADKLKYPLIINFFYEGGQRKYAVTKRNAVNDEIVDITVSFEDDQWRDSGQINLSNLLQAYTMSFIFTKWQIQLLDRQEKDWVLIAWQTPGFAQDRWLHPQAHLILLKPDGSFLKKLPPSSLGLGKENFPTYFKTALGPDQQTIFLMVGDGAEGIPSILYRYTIDE